jgi:hypothetical protein
VSFLAKYIGKIPAQSLLEDKYVIAPEQGAERWYSPPSLSSTDASQPPIRPKKFDLVCAWPVEILRYFALDVGGTGAVQRFWYGWKM